MKALLNRLMQEDETYDELLSRLTREKLMTEGVQLAPRDIMIATTARSTGAELVVAGSDFDVEIFREYMNLRDLRLE